MEFVKPYQKDGDKRYCYTNIGRAVLNNGEILTIKLNFFPIFTPGSFIMLKPEEDEVVDFRYNVYGMKRLKILLPSSYQTSNGELKTIYKNAGYAFVNKTEGRIENINLYIDMFPFNENIVFHLKEVN